MWGSSMTTSMLTYWYADNISGSQHLDVGLQHDKVEELFRALDLGTHFPY